MGAFDQNLYQNEDTQASTFDHFYYSLQQVFQNKEFIRNLLQDIPGTPSAVIEKLNKGESLTTMEKSHAVAQWKRDNIERIVQGRLERFNLTGYFIEELRKENWVSEEVATEIIGALQAISDQGIKRITATPVNFADPQIKPFLAIRKIEKQDEYLSAFAENLETHQRIRTAAWEDGKIAFEQLLRASKDTRLLNAIEEKQKYAETAARTQAL